MVEWLEFIKTTLIASWEEVARILGVRERTVQRWRKGQNFPRAKNLEKIKALKEVCSLLSEYPEALRARFLAAKDPITQKTPAELLREGKINEVLEQLYALAEGGAY